MSRSVFYLLVVLGLLAASVSAVSVDRRTGAQGVLDSNTDTDVDIAVAEHSLNELTVDAGVDAAASTEAELEAAGVITFAAGNAKAHKTSQYRESTGGPVTRFAILRRNAPFDVTVPGGADGMKFTIELGKETAPVDVKSIVKAGAAATATLTHTQGAIGKFKLVAKDAAGKVLASGDVVFIANPYSTADETYVSKAHTTAEGTFSPELAEHLENEKGALWQGSATRNAWIPWAFNQFDVSVLETVTDLLQALNLKQRASTALVTRHLTTAESDVLQGRWDGEYSDGKQPGFWASSTQIISQYRKTKTVVKYGQCWVFAGLLTSFCRSIGIPSRPLTNFESAHEHAPFDQQCHTKYKKTATGYERVSADNSIWNFHVWVDAWMTRPDVAGNAADGWQAIDATPQELSSGPKEAPFTVKDYRCGPASLKQIKAMAVTGDYDVAFVAGEANCLKVDYVDGKEINRDPSSVGETMLTKAPDTQCSTEKVGTNGYTNVCQLNLARAYSKPGSFLQLSHEFRSRAQASKYSVLVNGKPQSDVRLGKAFTIAVQGKEVPGAIYSITLSSQSYNSKHTFGTLRQVTATSLAEAQIAVTHADWSNFKKHGVPSKTATLDLIVVVTVPGATKPWLHHRQIVIALPKLAMLCGRKERTFKSEQTIACNVQFFNPLPYPITGATMAFSISGQASSSEQESLQQIAGQKLTIETSAVAVATDSDTVPTVDPTSRSTFQAKFPLKGAIGSQMIIAKLSSPELDGIQGVMEITITA